MDRIGQNDRTDWLVKHGMRTLLKAGHPKAMALFGYASINVLHIETLKVNTPTVSFGNHLKFEFSLAKKTRRADRSLRVCYSFYEK